MTSEETLLYEQANSLAKKFDAQVWSACKAGSIGLAAMIITAKALDSIEGEHEMVLSWLLQGLADACAEYKLEIDWPAVCATFLAAQEGSNVTRS